MAHFTYFPPFPPLRSRSPYMSNEGFVVIFQKKENEHFGSKIFVRRQSGIQQNLGSLHGYVNSAVNGNSEHLLRLELKKKMYTRLHTVFL
mmetsp:Transcript_9873/g.13228  ORF Transcript_9873/g.13228 Transcript_9873/m.13228 type:complete len:90 (+) Transcript_9873:23-292(+)